jgi:hypothetical protein
VKVERGPLTVSVSDGGSERACAVAIILRSSARPHAPHRLGPGTARRRKTVVARIEPSDPRLRRTQRGKGAREHECGGVPHSRGGRFVARRRSWSSRNPSSLASDSAATVSENDLDSAERRAKTADAALGRPVPNSRSANRITRSPCPADDAGLTRAADCDCVTVYSPVSGDVLRVVTESGGVVRKDADPEVGDLTRR